MTKQGGPCGVAVNMLEFELELHYYVHFRTNTLEKGRNPLNSSGMG